MAATIVSPGDSSDAKNKLMQLFEKDWQWEIVDNPEFACQAGSYLKYEDGTSLLQDVSPAGYLQRKDHSTEMLKELDAVLSLGGLNSEQLLLADLFAMSHNGIAKNIDLCKSNLYALNSTGTGCPTFSFIEAVEWMRFETIADYKLYLRRLNAFPVQMQMFIDSLHEGIRTGYTCSRAQVRKVASQVEAIIASQFAALREPLAGLLQLPGGDSGGSGGDNNALLDDIEAALRSDGVVANAFKMFLEFFLSEEMQSSLRVDPAVSALPNGRAIYAACLEYHTTTSLTADDIHALGLSEVARIETRYREEVLKPMGFEPDDFTAFVQHARSHPAYYVSNAEQLLNRYRAVCERIAHIMPTYFADIPASPLEITSKEVGPAAYYLAGTPDGKRPGRFYVNVSNISERPVYESVALSLHEAIPGHHHQISLAMENTNIPAFLRFIEDRRYEICPSRRNLYTGYMEGWALYCEVNEIFLVVEDACFIYIMKYIYTYIVLTNPMLFVHCYYYYPVSR